MRGPSLFPLFSAADVFALDGGDEVGHRHHEAEDEGEEVHADAGDVGVGDDAEQHRHRAQHDEEDAPGDALGLYARSFTPGMPATRPNTALAARARTPR